MVYTPCLSLQEDSAFAGPNMQKEKQSQWQDWGCFILFFLKVAFVIKTVTKKKNTLFPTWGDEDDLSEFNS